MKLWRKLNRLYATFFANSLLRSVSCFILMSVDRLASGSSCTTSFNSVCKLTVGLSDQPVWKMSEGLSLAMAPTNSRPVYGGTLKYRAATWNYGNKFSLTTK